MVGRGKCHFAEANAPRAELDKLSTTMRTP
jgi:hypothetical protein